jgi:hypothetical protein
MIKELKIKRAIRKDTQYLGDLQHLVMNDPTPNSDESMIRYLLDSIEWLDSFDEQL